MKKAASTNWIDGVPEIEYPTDNEGWAHCLTIAECIKCRKWLILTNVHIQRWKNYVTIKRQH